MPKHQSLSEFFSQVANRDAFRNQIRSSFGYGMRTLVLDFEEDNVKVTSKDLPLLEQAVAEINVNTDDTSSQAPVRIESVQVSKGNKAVIRFTR